MDTVGGSGYVVWRVDVYVGVLVGAGERGDVWSDLAVMVEVEVEV